MLKVSFLTTLSLPSLLATQLINITMGKNKTKETYKDFTFKSNQNLNSAEHNTTTLSIII